MYDETCAIQNDLTRRKLQEIWERYPTRYDNKSNQPPAGENEDVIDLSKLPKYFYVNKLTGSSQWSIPYYANSFSAVDVEATAFEKCIFNRDIIEKWYDMLSPIILS